MALLPITESYEYGGVGGAISEKKTVIPPKEKSLRLCAFALISSGYRPSFPASPSKPTTPSPAFDLLVGFKGFCKRSYRTYYQFSCSNRQTSDPGVAQRTWSFETPTFNARRFEGKCLNLDDAACHEGLQCVSHDLFEDPKCLFAGAVAGIHGSGRYVHH